MKSLSNLNKKEFNLLKKLGYLWEFYPNAPEFYEKIEKFTNYKNSKNKRK